MKTCPKQWNYLMTLSQSEAFLDTHLQSIVNIGCPQNDNNEDSLQEAYKEMYNAEQNEILQLNIESTIQRQTNSVRSRLS